MVGTRSCREHEGPSPRAVRTGVRVARVATLWWSFASVVAFVDLLPVSLLGASVHPTQSGWFQSSCREPGLSFLPVLTQFVKFVQAPGGGPLATPDVAWLNELQAVGGGTSGTILYGYDANGNQTSRTEGTVTESFGYDFLNRLSSYVKTSGSTQEAVTYGYMPTGERHLKHTTVQSGNPLDEKRWFMVDGADIATEYTQMGAGSLNLSVSYLQSLGIDSKLARITAPSGALHYYVPDALGSVMQLVDTTQQSVNREVTTAWGEPLPAFTPVLGVPDRFGFGQREKDSESGLGHHRYRTLDYRTGRFLQNEPMFANRPREHYSYARNNPVLYTDPTGEIVKFTRRGTGSRNLAILDGLSELFGKNLRLNPSENTVTFGEPRIFSKDEQLAKKFDDLVLDTQAHSIEEFFESVLSKKDSDSSKLAWSYFNALAYHRSDGRDRALEFTIGAAKAAAQPVYVVNDIAYGFGAPTEPKSALVQRGVQRGLQGASLGQIWAENTAIGTLYSNPVTGPIAGGYHVVHGVASDNYEEAGGGAFGALATGAYWGTRGQPVATQSSVVGTKITGYTRHGLNQAIGREGHGVSPRAILDAVRNPTQIILQPERGTILYIGREAAVSLSESGQVVTTWAWTQAAWRVKP